jgi:adenylate cyclase
VALRNDEVPEARRIVFRIGINLGEIIIDEDDPYGDGVNVATRVEALA